MITPYDTRLPADLAALKQEIEGYAAEYGLDFYETIFEVVDAEDLNEIAAYGGFPTRYPHWSFGMSFEELKKGYDYGLSKIYEMVINNDPCYAYLMRCNHTIDQKLVMAHVYGHCDFFKNNAYFAHTNRKMMDEMANHGMRIRRYAERYGEDEVEAFVDRCMSIDDLIDIHSTAIRRRKEDSKYDFKEETEDESMRLTRFRSERGYMDDYINPPEQLKREEEEKRKEKEEAAKNFPEQPEKDVLLFLIKYAPLKPWQRDVLSIIRDEAYYFTPQGQTKIMNEGWACVTENCLVYTDHGLVRMKELVESRKSVALSDGESVQRVYDWAKFEDRETIKIRTCRGFEIEGSTNHRVLGTDGKWHQLDQLEVGSRVRLHRETELWGQDYQLLNASLEAFPNNVSSKFGVGETGGVAIAEPRAASRTRQAVRIPELVDEQVGAFLGRLAAGGHLSVVPSSNNTISGVRLTTSLESQISQVAALVETLFEIRRPKTHKDCEGWHIGFPTSRDLHGELLQLGFPESRHQQIQNVPDVILRSPRAVVVAFLKAYFDTRAWINNNGLSVWTPSDDFSRTVQTLLLNFGILSSRHEQAHDGWVVQISGKSAQLFESEIGLETTRLQRALRDYVTELALEEEVWEDEIVSIERRRADVYDISVEETHRYAAQGFINHNSYWHSTIMTQRCLTGAELIDYADHHSGTMATSPGRLNPYKLGIELLRDIEHRWNTGKFGKEYDDCDDLETRRNWDKQLGLGRKKIFEVRRIYNDITFIDTFLTPEFCVKYGLFAYAYDEHMGQYYIESRNFEQIKKRLLFSLTNFGKPWIYVVDGNFRNRGELLLRHEYNGIDLQLDKAADTLANIQFLWNRPVHLQTVVEDKPTLLTFDGTEHSIRNLGEADDPRKHTDENPF